MDNNRKPRHLWEGRVDGMQGRGRERLELEEPM
jgi:hypothetical protein